MAATQYMVLYRYINENTNLPITNDPSNDYEEVREFYTSCHKMYSGNMAQQDAGYQEQQDIITNATDSNNPKFDMFFAYDGTRKIRHKGIDGKDHIEEPYMIKDMYKRIPLSPWFTNCVTGSLDVALEKAKKLVSMIGKENVRIQKLVRFEQQIKIK